MGSGKSLRCKDYKSVGNYWTIPKKENLCRILVVSFAALCYRPNDYDMYPDKTPRQMKQFVRCVNLMLHYDTPIGTFLHCNVEMKKDDLYTTKNSSLLTVLFVAGAVFDIIPPQLPIPDHPDFKPTEFVRYIENKFYPDKDENGFFQPDTLEEISRDFVREHLVAHNEMSNLFVLVPQLPVPKPLKELLLYYNTLED